ncbi:MAG: hypothetical protein PHQ64_02170 [Bacilli bacterium]|nr:hypothetical protein [Bacilli bacterium]
MKKKLYILAIFFLGLSFSILGTGLYLKTNISYALTNKNEKTNLIEDKYNSSIMFTIYKEDDVKLGTYKVPKETTLSTNPTNKQMAYLLSKISTASISYSDLTFDLNLKNFIEKNDTSFDISKYSYFNINLKDTINISSYEFKIYEESFDYLDSYSPNSINVVKYVAVCKIGNMYFSISYNEDFLKDINTNYQDFISGLVK